MTIIRALSFFALFLLLSAGTTFAQATGSIGGTVTDANAAAVPGATVTVLAADGKKKEFLTNAQGEYTITGLAPGTYTVKAIKTGFELYQNEAVALKAGPKTELLITLLPASIDVKVDVDTTTQISNDPESNKDATVLKGADLDALPDDPDEMAAALQALAGASAGPNGGQIYIDGFTGGQMPPKESIREIRINQNPLSAEFDRPGFGRIEILTKPGTDKWRGSANGSFNDESLNSRNPFALNRAPTQSRNFGGNLSGPIVKKNSSFFVDVNSRSNDNSTIINAQIIDPSFNIVGFRRDVTQPTTRLSISPRVDFALNSKNTLVARYSFTHSKSNNLGISETSLPSRAYKSSSNEHEVRLTESMIINAKTVNETRFEVSSTKSQQDGDNSIPTVGVSSAFTGGGASIGQSFNDNKTWEINNMTITSFNKARHSVKFGGRLRYVEIRNRSESNYAGTFSFPGFSELHSPVGCSPVGVGCVVTAPAISSIDQYRQKLLGVVNPSYSNFNPTQFTITTGTPLAAVNQYDGAVFFTDDWRINPALLLSFGLRYENQTNISDKGNFAPRVGVAWSPGAGGAKQPKTVFRGGFGIFYDRFGEGNTLSALRSTSQLSLLVSANDPDPVRKAAALTLLSQPVFTLTGVTNVPTAAQILTALPQSNTIRQVDIGLRSPEQLLGQISVDRTLTSKLTLSVNYSMTKTLHALRTRNINAPICPNFATAPCTGARPQLGFGNINEYESTGTQNSKALAVNLQARLSPKFTLFGSYRYGFQKGDTDGAGSAPAYSYDLTGEYGRASFDVRHSFTLFGNFTLPWAVSISPIIQASSGRPFNITSGVDKNGDGFFNERPTFGELQTKCSQLGLTNSFCDIGSNSLTTTVPRNYGQGPDSFSVSLRLSKNFGFGKSPKARVADNGGGGGGNRGGGGNTVMMGGPGGGGGGGMMRGGGGGFGGDARKPYNLNVGVFVTNLLNNVNYGNPSGSLTSFRFGQSTSTAGGFGGGGFGGGGGGGSSANRKIELNMRFNW